MPESILHSCSGNKVCHCHLHLDLYRSCEHFVWVVDSCPTARRGDISAIMPWKVNSYTWRITGSYKLTVSLAFCCSQLLPVCAFNFKYVALRQFILVLSSVELTSILVPSYRLRVTALLSPGCRATVESLPMLIVSLQHIVAELDANCTCHVGKVQSPAIKSYSANPFFHYSAFPSVPLVL